jgi:hypothetical protein
VALEPLVKARPLSYRDTPIQFPANGELQRVFLRKSEAFVWLSITRRDPNCPHLKNPATAIPALVDTGCNEGLFIHEWHLANWFDMPLGSFDPAGEPGMVHYQHCPRIRLDVWLHPYEGKSTKEPPTEFRNAAKMQLPNGALVSVLRYAKMFRVEDTPPKFRWWKLADWFLRTQAAKSSETNKEIDDWGRSAHAHDTDSIPLNVYPRLPLIGTKLLLANRLVLELNGITGAFSLSQPARPVE